MPQNRNLLIVIADGEHARLVSPAEDNALHTQIVLDSDVAGLNSSYLGSDHPGAVFHSDSSSRHSITPRHDPHRLAKERFARTVAAAIEALAKETDDLEFLLVAPSYVLSVIHDALSPALARRILGQLEKDLAKVPDHRLWPHLKSWVPPVRRASGEGPFCLD